MKRFKKWRNSGTDPTEADDAQSTIGTPVGAEGEDLREFMSDVDGFDHSADAYVYSVVLIRRMDGTEWYYVGQTTSGEEGLKGRLRKHIRGEMKKPVRRNGIDVLDTRVPENTTDTYATIGVERVESILVDSEELLEARTLERERKTAYEIALEKQTTNVLGGS